MRKEGRRLTGSLSVAVSKVREFVSGGSHLGYLVSCAIAKCYAV